ncbi:MAG: glycosyltransferase family 4 protein [Holophagae bacterium]|nr:glycosyltransferase family 4 protein [Holophagae bacterium]
MKILHVTNLFPIAGNPAYGIFVKEQVESLRALGVDCEILFINARQKGRLEYLRAVSRIREAAKGADLIHAHHAYSGLLSLRARTGLPLVTSFLNVPGRQSRVHMPVFNRLIYRYVRGHSTRFIYKETAPAGISVPEHGVHLPNGVDLSFFNEISRKEAISNLGLDAGINYAPFVSSIGTVRKQKRYDLFQATLAVLKNKMTDVNELILSGTERHLVPYYFNSASLLLLTSDFEGSPNVVKEALACNIPVVSRDVGNVREMIEGVSGCFVSASADPVELAGLVRQAMEHKRVQGRNRLQELKLDMESVAGRLKDIYREVLAENVKGDDI